MKTIEIFLVEPDDERRLFFINLFREEGLSVKPFATSEQMLIYLMQNPTGLKNYRCVLLNEYQPGINGLNAQLQIRKLEPELRIIFYSYKPSVESVIAAWRNGASNFFYPPFIKSELLESVREVLNKKISRQYIEDNAAIESLRLSYRSLTSREKEVLLLISRGRKNHEIASDLEISTPTVKMHRSNLMRKLEINNIAQLISFHHRCIKHLEI